MHAGEGLARTGVNIVKDVVRGGDVKSSAQSHFKKLGHTLVDDASVFIKNQIGTGCKRKRTSVNHHKSKKCRRVQDDIFCSQE